MDQLRQLVERLNWRQRIHIAITALVAVGLLYGLLRWNRERAFEPLFSALAAEDAGAVTARLRDMNLEYRLAEGGATILVEREKVAEVRLQLAAAGLPQSGRIGFELFDQSTFGASEFTEQVNYHRAMEGELERSVMSLREVERARVHLTMAKESLYTAERQPAKASILVKLRPGAVLSPQNIAAVTHLAASAVPGLQAAQVTVVDTNGNLLNRPRLASGAGSEASEAALEYRKSLERDLQLKIAQTLEPLLGAEHFRVGVSADVDLSSGEQSEEVFDPEKSVMTSSQTSEDIPSSALADASGVPGTASNLPRATASQQEASAVRPVFGRRTENVNYQTSRTVRQTRIAAGAVKRLSISILADHTLRYEQGKPVIEAPAPEKLQVIKDLVAAAVGLDTARGDQLVVEAFPFEATLAAQPLDLDQPSAPQSAPGGIGLPAWLARWFGQGNTVVLTAAAGGVLALLLAAVVFLWRWRGKKPPVAVTAQLEGAPGKQISSHVEDARREMEARLAGQAAEQQRLEAEAILSMKVPAVTTKKTDILTKHITEEVKKDPASTAQVVRSWLNGDYQR
jgi:flagellar M-ring protein FliF